MSKQLELHQIFKETFSTQQGAKCLEILKQYYDQVIGPQMPKDEMVFHCGQRDVVHYILDMVRGPDK